MDIDIKSKIRKLLALAAGCNEHEAALAMEKAQKLMDIYRISQVGIGSDIIVEDPEPLFAGGRIPGWKTTLAMVLANYNNCVILKFKSGGKINRESKLMIYGYPTDIEHLRYILAWIVTSLNRSGLIACVGEGHRYKDSWYNGAVNGIRIKIADAREEVRKQTESKLFALATISRLNKVEEFVNKKYTNITYKKGPSKTFNKEAYLTGLKHGKNMSLSEG